MTRPTQLTRALVAVGLASTAVVAANAPASAATGDITYDCRWYVGLDIGPTGTDDATVHVDTGIADGATATAGSSISVDPLTGSVTLPQPFVDALRAEGVPEFHGFADIAAPWAGDPTRRTFFFDVASVPIPATGGMTLRLDGRPGGTVTVGDPGSYTLVAGHFGLVSDDDFNGMSCTVAPGVDAALLAIDTVTVTAATATPTATTTPSATATTDPGSSPTATAVRPALVQTDAVDAGPSPALALVGLVLLAGAGLWAGGVLAARRAAARRH